MENKFKFLIIFSIIFLISLIFSFVLFIEHNNKIILNENFTVESITNISTLKKLILEKYDYISKNSGVYQPFNKKYFDFIRNKLQNSNNLTYANLIGYTTLISNNSLGYGSILPLKNPLNSLSFQYNSGLSGWYWIYYTDITNKCSFLFLLTRVDLVPELINKENNLQHGESTLYVLTVGCGNKEKYVSTPFITVAGKFTNSSTGITFSTIDEKTSTNNAPVLNFSCTNSGNIMIDFKGLDSTGDKLILETKLMTDTSPKFNGNDGCYPLCAAGLGSNYWSFTNLKLDGNQNFYQIGNNKQILSTNGKGWMDRQWFRLKNPNSIFLKIMSLYGKQVSGLGTYIWITIQLKNKQYLVIFQGNTSVNANTQLKAIYNTYTGDSVELKRKCNIIVKEVGNIPELKGVNYPVTLDISLDNGENFTSSCKETGLGYVLDPTNNIHQTSGSIIRDVKGNVVGSGLIEANNLQSQEIINKNSFNIIGLDYNNVPSRDVENSQKTPGIVTITIYTMFILLVIVFLSLTISKFRKRGV